MNSAADLGVQPRLLSIDDYHRMAEAGVFAPEERVELIEGGIVQMAPIGSPHGGMVKRLNRLLTDAVRQHAIVSVQDPIQLGNYSEPEPDLALLRPRADFYDRAHPTASSVLLVVEVAQSSLKYDRELKLPLYARHSIPEAWLVDVDKRVLHMFREPGASDYARFDTTAKPGKLRLVALPDIEIDLTGLFD